MNRPSLKSKPLSKEIPTIQVSFVHQSREIALTDFRFMISIAIFGRIVLIVDGEMLESSFQCFGSHGDSKEWLFFSGTKPKCRYILEEMIIVNLQVLN